MSTLEMTVTMLKSLPESDLLTIYDMTRKFYMKQGKEKELKAMTESQILDRLDASRKQAEKGMVMEADAAVSKLRTKYGL